MQKILNNKNEISKLCLLILITIYISINIWWLNVDNRIPFAAPPWYFNNSFRYWNLFQQFSLSRFQRIAVTIFHPPLVGMIISPFYSFFGKNIDVTVIFMNIIFLPILLVSIYKLTLLLSKKPFIALLSSFIIITYPTIITLSRYYMFELPLAALVSLAIYYLFLVNDFTNRKYSILLGIILGLGMLIKLSFIIFVFLPLIYIMFKIPNHKYLKNVFITLSIFLFITGLWYLPLCPQYIKKLFHAATYTGLMESDPKWSSLEGITYYVLLLINSQLSFFYVLLFIIALALFIHSPLPKKTIFYLWLIIPYIIFTFVWSKEDRYIVPYLPAFAIITAVGLGTIKRNIIRRIPFSFLIIYGVLQFTTCTWAIPWFPEKISLKNLDKIYFFHQAPYTQRNFYSPRPENKIDNYKRENYIYDIFTKINSDINNMKNYFKRTIFILSNRWSYNAASLDYFSILNNINLRFWNIIESELDVSSVINLIQQKRYGYIIDIKELSYPDWQEYEMKLQAIREWLNSHSEDFEILLEKWIPEDNLTLIVFKRKLSY